MRGSSKCKLGKERRKKIYHYFQNKKIYWGGGEMIEKQVLAQSTRSILLVVLYYIVLWTSISGQEYRPLLLLLYDWKDAKSWLQQQKQQNPASLQLQPLPSDHF